MVHLIEPELSTSTLSPSPPLSPLKRRCEENKRRLSSTGPRKLQIYGEEIDEKDK